MLMGAHPCEVFVVRPEPFWDTHRVENCGRGHKKGEVSTYIYYIFMFFVNIIYRSVAHVKIERHYHF